MGTRLAFVLVCIGIVLLRKTYLDTPRPFRTPGLPWVAVAGAAICLLQMIALRLPTWERLVIWLLIGMVIYFGYAKRNAKRHRASRA